MILPLIFGNIYQWRHLVLGLSLEGFVCVCVCVCVNKNHFINFIIWGVKNHFINFVIWGVKNLGKAQEKQLFSMTLEKNAAIIYCQNFRTRIIIEDNLVYVVWEPSYLGIFFVGRCFWFLFVCFCFLTLLLDQITFWVLHFSSVWFFVSSYHFFKYSFCPILFYLFFLYTNYLNIKSY